jgi:outer membrane receptor protein involved in Fe transport
VGAFHQDREVFERQVMHLPQDWVDARGGSIGGLSNDYMGVDNAFIYGSPVTDNLTETALFAELGYQISDSLKATLGFRSSEIEIKNMRTAGGNMSIGAFLMPVVFGGATSFTPVPFMYGKYAPGKVKPNTMKVSLAWKASDNVNYYATASEGFRANDVNRAAYVPGLSGELGTSNLDATDPTVIQKFSKPDMMWNYEVGMKGQWDGIRANLAIYQMVWEDIQLFAQRVSDTATFFTNAGEAESTGVELDILGRPNDFFEYGLAIAHQKAEITKITAAESAMVGAVLGSSLSSPDLQVSGHLQFNKPLDSGAGLFARVDVSDTDRMPNGFPFNPGTGADSPNFGYTDSITKVDLSIGYVTDNLSAVLYAENAFDDNGYTFIMPQTFFDDRHMTLRPRTIGIRFTLNK